MHFIKNTISRIFRLLARGRSMTTMSTPEDILRTIRNIGSRQNKAKMPIEIDQIAEEARVSKAELKRHLRQLDNSDFLFYEGKAVLLSFSGLHSEYR